MTDIFEGKTPDQIRELIEQGQNALKAASVSRINELRSEIAERFTELHELEGVPSALLEAMSDKNGSFNPNRALRKLKE